FVAIIWGLEIVDWVLQGWWTTNNWGILPRTFIGLRGIIFAPFLHGSFAHVAANTIPFLVLGGLIMLRRPSNFWAVTIATTIIGGVGTWLFGRTSMHIGASGLIFGYFGFLLTLGYFERSLPAVLQSIIVGAIYGGLIWGVLPAQPGISWEGHLFGFLAGVFTAYLLAERKDLKSQIKIRTDESWEV
ncbi:MAG: rhomboid family intramembrane serine protease, partial [Anaerolineales bacterium]|nr:rhomboid family intramembrane serine protease [Anaerolineales bacterium]